MFMIKEIMDKGNQENKRKRIFAILKILILLVILVGIPAYILIFHRDLITQLKSFDHVTSMLKSYKTAGGALVYLTAQILQIVISILPGQVFQIAAGYVFGFFPGLLLSIAGVLAGTTLTYYLAKILGTDGMEWILGSDKMKRFVSMLNSEKAYIIIFLIYLIPGMPKDLICYAAGISGVDFRRFLLISTIGRIPAMCGSLLFGALYRRGNYGLMITLATIITVVVVICFFRRKQLSDLLKRINLNHTSEKTDPE